MHPTTKLTAAFVKAVRHSGNRTQNGSGRLVIDRHYDQHGLYLQVMPSGSKQWLQRITVNGKRCDFGLGGYPVDLTLGEARERAFANLREARAYRKARARGESPPVPAFEADRQRTVAARKRKPAPAVVVAGMTFGQAFEAFLTERAPTWKATVRASSLRSWRAHLRDYLHCVAALPVATLTSADLEQCLAPVRAQKPHTAAKATRRAGTVFEWSIVKGYRTDNPARAVARAAPKRINGVAHYKALPHGEISTMLAKVAASKSGEAVKGAFRLQVLTAVRGGEARLADWSEIDLERAVWTIPAARMKYSDRGHHRVPLNPQALALLKAAGPKKAKGLVFEARGGNPVSESAFRKMLGRLGIEANPHGARSSFRDWAAEAGYSREIAEAALAHTVGGVEAAYRRTTFFEQRRAMMDAWGEFAGTGH